MFRLLAYQKFLIPNHQETKALFSKLNSKSLFYFFTFIFVPRSNYKAVSICQTLLKL